MFIFPKQSESNYISILHDPLLGQTKSYIVSLITKWYNFEKALFMKTKKQNFDFIVDISHNKLALFISNIVPLLIGLYFFSISIYLLIDKSFIPATIFFSFTLICSFFILRKALPFIKIKNQQVYARNFFKIYKYHLRDFDSFCKSSNKKYLYIWFKKKCFKIPTFFYNTHRLISILKPMHYPFTTDEGLEKLIDFFKAKTLKKTYCLLPVPNSTPNLFSSKIYGYPYWDFSKDYPLDENGNKMTLLCQLNFSEYDFQNMLPKNGILQFFLSHEAASYGANQDVLNTNQKNWRIVFHEKIDERISLDKIIKSGIPSIQNKQSFEITFNAQESIASLDSYKFNQLILEAAKEIAGLEDFTGTITDLIGSEIYYPNSEKFYSFAHEPNNHILGNLGFDTFINASESANYYDTTLLKLKVNFDDDDFDLYFLINSDDLKNLDFSKVIYFWNYF